MIGRSGPATIHVSSGLPGFHVIGAPADLERDTRDRIRCALLSSGLPWPMRRITADVGPELRPEHDLPIALALLAAIGELRQGDLTDRPYLSRLTLDGAAPDLVALRGATPYPETLRHLVKVLGAS